MIVCDNCGKNNDKSKDSDFFTLYCYPRYMQVKQPSKIDFCDECLIDIMGKERFSDMLENFNNSDV